MGGDTAWGIGLCAYILSGLPFLAGTARSPNNGLPGGQWQQEDKAREARAGRHLGIWCMGLVVVLTSWTLYKADNSLWVAALVGVPLCYIILIVTRARTKARRLTSDDRDTNLTKTAPDKREGARMNIPDFNVWQRGVFGIGAAITAAMINESWDYYDGKIPALGIALGVGLAALAVAPKRKT